MATPIARRFVQAVEKGEDTRRLRAILEMSSKDDLMSWTDENGLDLLHYCILHENAEAADFLLKQGYFVRPYQPRLNLYLHLAALLGNKTLVTVLVQHRPDDFRMAEQSLLLPPGFSAPRNKAALPKPLDAASSKASLLSTPRRPNTPSRASDSPLNKSSTSPSRPVDGPLNKTSSTSPNRSQDNKTSSYSSSTSPNRSQDNKTSSSYSSSTSPSRSQDNKTSQASTPRRPATPTRNTETAGDASTPRRSAKTASPYVDGLLTDGSKPLMMTPLEVGARARNIDCVRVLLDLCVLKANPDAPSKGYMTLAALADCPPAMALVIKCTKQDKTTAEDYRAAVEICVQRALPECLDLLLGNAPNNLDPRSLFKQINYFHVLYTFSATYGKGTYGRLPEATRVLIRRGHDVSAKIPPRTYPLYTLLTHAFCYHDYSYTQHYVECLKLLLQEGADPNFDEVEFEKRLLQQKGIKFVAGRNAYASALHCLLETVETYASQLSSKALAVRFVEDCAEVLIRHNADIGKVGRIGDARSDLQGNVLHQYAKSSVTLGVDKAILQCILRFGAEPDVKVNDKYAINVYFDKLFEKLMLCEVVDTHHQYEHDVNMMMELLCRYMTSAHIREAAFLFKRSHGRTMSEQVKYYIQRVLEDFDRRSRQVRPLQGLVAWKIWKMCGKQPEIVRQLPVKVELKTLILPFL